MKISKKTALYVLLIIWILRVYYSPFFTSFAKPIAYIYATYIGICIIINYINNRKVPHIFINGLKTFLIPFFLVTVISILSAAFYYHTENHSDITQSIVRMIDYSTAFLIAYKTYLSFKGKSLNVFLIACWVSYIPVIIKWIFSAGIPGIFHIFNTYNGVSLEVHNITYCFGIALLYFVVTGKYKDNFHLFVLLIIGIIIGNKRALYIGIVLSLIVYYLLFKSEKKNRIILYFVVFLVFISSFISLLLIKYGYFELIIHKLGIRDSSRLAFWNYFGQYYELSPFYMGRGIAFSDNLSAQKDTMLALGVYDGAVPIHNDILRTYIGWGCIPFLYYYYNFFVLSTKKLVKSHNSIIGWRYLIIALCTFAIYYFDNCIAEITFNICFFIIYFLLASDEDCYGWQNVKKSGRVKNEKIYFDD